MHNIEYRVYPEKVDKAKVHKELDQYIHTQTIGEGGHGLISDIRYLNNAGIAKDRQEAEDIIKKRDKGWYDQLAVRFYAPNVKSLVNNKTLVSLRAKQAEAYSNYTDKNGALYAETRTSEFISCRKCGSSLSRVHIRTNRCPVCGADLRPETTLKAIEAAKAKWKKAEKAANDYEMAHSKKEVMWLVKIEYHT